MRKIERTEPETRTGRIEQACNRYGVGKNTMRMLAKEANAVVRIGRTYLINYAKVDAYVDSLSGE